MKKILTTLGASLMALYCFAGDMVDHSFLSVSTNITASAASDTKTSGKVGGWYDTLIVDISSDMSAIAPTCTLSVATTADVGTGAARTILSTKVITADDAFPIRDLIALQSGVSVTNVAFTKIALVGNTIATSAYLSNSTNVTLTPVVLNIYHVMSDDN